MENPVPDFENTGFKPSFFSRISKRQIVSFGGFVLVAAGLAVALYLVQKTQIFNPKATADLISFLNSAGSALPLENNIPVAGFRDIKLNLSPPDTPSSGSQTVNIQNPQIHSQPVISWGDTAYHDSAGARDPWIVKDGGTYYLYYDCTETLYNTNFESNMGTNGWEAEQATIEADPNGAGDYPVRGGHALKVTTSGGSAGQGAYSGRYWWDNSNRIGENLAAPAGMEVMPSTRYTVAVDFYADSGTPMKILVKQFTGNPSEYNNKWISTADVSRSVNGSGGWQREAMEFDTNVNATAITISFVSNRISSTTSWWDNVRVMRGGQTNTQLPGDFGGKNLSLQDVIGWKPCVATSTDGVNFSKRGLVTITGNLGSWDNMHQPGWAGASIIYLNVFKNSQDNLWYAYYWKGGQPLRGLSGDDLYYTRRIQFPVGNGYDASGQKSNQGTSDLPRDRSGLARSRDGPLGPFERISQSGPQVQPRDFSKCRNDTRTEQDVLSGGWGCEYLTVNSKPEFINGQWVLFLSGSVTREMGVWRGIHDNIFGITGGYATGPGPLGPWTSSEYNPLFSNTWDAAGGPIEGINYYFDSGSGNHVLFYNRLGGGAYSIDALWSRQFGGKWDIVSGNWHRIITRDQIPWLSNSNNGKAINLPTIVEDGAGRLNLYFGSRVSTVAQDHATELEKRSYLFHDIGLLKFNLPLLPSAPYNLAGVKIAEGAESNLTGAAQQALVNPVSFQLSGLTGTKVVFVQYIYTNGIATQTLTRQASIIYRPNCDTTITCSGSCSAPANTCSANNGTQGSCVYTALSGGGTCTQVPAPNQACTQSNCSSGFTCNNGSCQSTTPNCNSGISCSGTCNAPANTCSTGNGTQGSCQYTTHSGGACNRVGAPDQSCTGNACSSGSSCANGCCSTALVSFSVTNPTGFSTAPTGTTAVTWNAQNGAASYSLRIDDLDDGTNIGTTCATKGPNDVCLDNLTVTSYQYSFQSGRRYAIWGDVFNGCGIGHGGTRTEFTVPLTACNAGPITCTGTCSASVANSCSFNNGLQNQCVYTTNSLNLACAPAAAPSQSCTVDACSSGSSCANGCCSVPLNSFTVLEPTNFSTTPVSSTTVRWNEQNSASSYSLRIDDLDDGTNIGTTCATKGPNDVCLDGLTTTTYQYFFQSGRRYALWGDVFNGCGIGHGGTRTEFTVPLAVCNSGVSCSGACSAPANTCSTSNGTQSCQYTTHSLNLACAPAAAPSQSCTVDACSAGQTCVSEACQIAVAPEPSISPSPVQEPTASTAPAFALQGFKLAETEAGLANAQVRQYSGAFEYTFADNNPGLKIIFVEYVYANGIETRTIVENQSVLYSPAVVPAPEPSAEPYVPPGESPGPTPEESLLPVPSPSPSPSLEPSPFPSVEPSPSPSSEPLPSPSAEPQPSPEALPSPSEEPTVPPAPVFVLQGFRIAESEAGLGSSVVQPYTGAFEYTFTDTTPGVKNIYVAFVYASVDQTRQVVESVAVLYRPQEPSPSPESLPSPSPETSPTQSAEPSPSLEPSPIPSAEPEVSPLPEPSPSLLPSVAPEASPSPHRIGDVDGDNRVGVLDLTIVVNYLDTSPPGDTRADLNNDNEVDIIDLGIVIDHFDL